LGWRAPAVAVGGGGKQEKPAAGEAERTSDDPTSQHETTSDLEGRNLERFHPQAVEAITQGDQTGKS